MQEFYFHKDPNLYNFNIFLSTICQYKCPYCFVRAKRSQWNKIMPKRDLQLIVQSMSKINGKLDISLLGGEPTLVKNNFQYMIDACTELDNCDAIDVITNGDVYLNNFNITNKCTISISYHPYNSIKEHLLRNIDYLRTNNIKFTVNFMISDDTETLNKALNFIKIANLKHFDYDFLLIRTNITHKYPDISKLKIPDETKNIYFNGEQYSLTEIYTKKINHFKGWKCIISNIDIDVEGYVKASCLPEDERINFNTFFKIFKEGTYISCPYDTCEDICLLNQNKFKN